MFDLQDRKTKVCVCVAIRCFKISLQPVYSCYILTGYSLSDKVILM